MNIRNEYGIDVIDFLNEHKRAVVAQVEKHLSNAYVLDRYRWISEYHNYKVPHFYDPEDYEEEELKQLIGDLMIPMSLFPSYKPFAV